MCSNASIEPAVVGMPWKQRTSRDLRHPRNNVDELAEWLDSTHGDNYLLWNLSGRDANVIDYDKFHGRVVEWEPERGTDHSIDVPTCQQAFRICYSLKFWLDWDPKHVAVMFCETSKFRTGFMMACFLAYYGKYDNCITALREFMNLRFSTDEFATLPSYMYSLLYFDNLSRMPVEPSPELVVAKIILIMPGAVALAQVPTVEVYEGRKKMFDSDEDCHDDEELRVWDNGSGSISFTVNVALIGDVQIRVLSYATAADAVAAAEAGGDDEESRDPRRHAAIDRIPTQRQVVRYCFHTRLLPPGAHVLRGDKVDLATDVVDKDEFEMHVILASTEAMARMGTPVRNRIVRRSAWSEVPLNLRGAEAQRQGMVQLTITYAEFPDPDVFRRLVEKGYNTDAVACALQVTRNDERRALKLLNSGLLLKLSGPPKPGQSKSPRRKKTPGSSGRRRSGRRSRRSRGGSSDGALLDDVPPSRRRSHSGRSSASSSGQSSPYVYVSADGWGDAKQVPRGSREDASHRRRSSEGALEGPNPSPGSRGRREQQGGPSERQRGRSSPPMVESPYSQHGVRNGTAMDAPLSTPSPYSTATGGGTPDAKRMRHSGGHYTGGPGAAPQSAHSDLGSGWVGVEAEGADGTGHGTGVGVAAGAAPRGVRHDIGSDWVGVDPAGAGVRAGGSDPRTAPAAVSAIDGDEWHAVYRGAPRGSSRDTPPPIPRPQQARSLSASRISPATHSRLSAAEHFDMPGLGRAHGGMSGGHGRSHSDADMWMGHESSQELLAAVAATAASPDSHDARHMGHTSPPVSPPVARNALLQAMQLAQSRSRSASSAGVSGGLRAGASETGWNRGSSGGLAAMGESKGEEEGPIAGTPAGARDAEAESRAGQDPRAALMAMLANRSSSGGSTTQQTESPTDAKGENSPSADPRAALMAMLAARGASSGGEGNGDSSSGREAEQSAESTEEAQPDPRAALTAMLTARGGGNKHSAVEAAAEAEGSPGRGGSSPPPDPRAALTAMLAARGAGSKDGAGEAAAETEETSGGDASSPPADPRAALMAMLASRGGKPSGATTSEPERNDADKGAQRPQPAGVNADDDGAAGAPDESPDGEQPATDARSALMAAIAKSKKPSAPQDAPKDPRAALMASLAKRAGNDGATAGPEEASSGSDSEGDAPAASPADMDHGGGGVPLKEHPKFAKYFKMMSVGLPKPVAAHKMEADGLDPALACILDMDGSQPLPGELPLKQHPKYAKYFKMLQVGLPPDAVKHKMTQEGVDPAVLDLDADKPLPPNAGKPKSKKERSRGGAGGAGASDESDEEEEEEEAEEEDDPHASVPVGEHPKFAKYFKMLKVGLPSAAVKHKMVQEGVDPDVLDLDPAQPRPRKSAGPPLKDDPVYGKFFKMLKVSVPVPAVKHKMMQEGLNPDVLDLDPEKPLPAKLTKKAKKPKQKKKKKAKQPARPRVLRKKLHWETLEDVGQNTIWSSPVASGSQSDLIDIDAAELEELFTKLPTARGAAAKASAASSKKKSTKVQLVDMKRATNVGIALASVKVPYDVIADCLLHLCCAMGKYELDLATLQSLVELVPDDTEIRQVKSYRGDPKALGEAERFFYALMDVPNLKARVSALVYQRQFDTSISNLQMEAATMLNACTQTRESARLKRVLRAILALGNKLNGTTDEDGGARGFKLQSLLRLSATKAFNNKTTVLHFLLSMIERGDRDLLRLREDLTLVPAAARISLSQLRSELANLRKGLTSVERLVREQAKEFGWGSMGAVGGFGSPAAHRPGGGAGGAASASSDETSSDAEEAGSDVLALSDFAAEAQRMLRETAEAVDLTAETFSGVLEFFGESDSMDESTFFSTLTEFLNSFDRAREDNAQQRKREERAAEKAAAEERRSRGAGARRQSVQPTRGPSLLDESSGGDGGAGGSALSSVVQSRPSTAALVAAAAQVRRSGSGDEEGGRPRSSSRRQSTMSAGLQ